MKKILAILFSVFYFGFSSGAVFSIHYCMEELVSVSRKIDDMCGKCGVKTKKDCCKTEIKIVKVDDSKTSSLLTIDFITYIPEPQKHRFFLLEKTFWRSKFTAVQNNAPPDQRSVPIFIQHCNFRI